MMNYQSIDRINNCSGEQPLLPYESCSLIAINLANHITKRGGRGGVDWSKLENSVKSAVLFMNRVLDKSSFPIVECDEAMKKTRKIGVGIMGFHDLLIELDIPYDSDLALSIAGDVMSFIASKAHEESVSLGMKEGLYGAAEEGVSPIRRNAALTTIAPTGTLSMLADCSSGCEPYYSPVTYKTVLDDNEFVLINKHIPGAVREKILSKESGGDIRDFFTEEEWVLYKGAEDISWDHHIEMQAAFQEHIDSSISKTINMPEESTVEDVKEAYMMAWEEGCKGITIYRNNSRDKQVLSDSKSTEGDTDKQGVTEFPIPYKLILEDELEATRYRIRDINGNKVYFTVCTQDDCPVEVFARLPEEVQDSSWHTISRLVSLALRYNVPLDDVTKQLRKSSSSISDIPSKLARILDKYKEEDNSESASNVVSCPNCGGMCIPGGGCWDCTDCGWSKCS